MSEVVVEVVLDASGAVVGARKASRAVTEIGDDGKRVTGTFQRMGTAIKTAFAFVFADVLARGLKAIVGKVFDLGTAVEETASKFSTVFGEAANEVDAFGDSFANMAGLTKRELREIAATAGGILQGMGADLERSAEQTEQLIRLAGDFASFNNTSIEEAFAAVRSGIVGESEPLKRYGVVLDEQSVKLRALADTGKTSEKQLTQLEKVQARLNLITERAGVAVGDLERTQDSTANTARRLTAQLREQGETIAQGLLPTFGFVLSVIEDVIDRADGANRTFAALAAEGVFSLTVQLTELVVAGANVSNILLKGAQAVGLYGKSTSLAGGIIGRWTDDLRAVRGVVDALTIAYYKANEGLNAFRLGIAESVGNRGEAAALRVRIAEARMAVVAIQEELKADNRAAGRRRAAAARFREELEALLDGLGDNQLAASDLRRELDDVLSGFGGAETKRALTALEEAEKALRDVKAAAEDLAGTDTERLATLQRQTEEYQRQIDRQRSLVAIEAARQEFDRLEGRSPTEFGRRGEAREAPLTPGEDQLDMSGTQVELRKTKDDVDALGEAFDNLGEITGNFADAAATAFGRNAAAFKAAALAETIIATARGISQALPNIPLAISVGALGAAQVAKILSTSVPGGGSSRGSSSGSGGVSTRTAGVVLGASAARQQQPGSPAPTNVSVNVTNSAEIVAVDGFAIRQKIRAVETLESGGLG